MPLFSATMEQHLVTVYGDTYSSQTEDDKVKINQLMWQHMFRVLDYSGLLRKLKRFKMRGSTLTLRKMLVADGRIFKAKLALYRIYETGNKHQVLYKLFQVQPGDQRVHHLLYQDPVLLRGFRAYQRDNFRSFSTRKWNRIVTEAAAISQGFSTRYVKKKMRFILTSNGMRPDDLASILVEEGIKAMMNMYPCFHSDLHAINVMKAAIHNQGNNLIDKFTTMKRNTLVENRDGTFSTLKLDFDFRVEDGDGEGSMAIDYVHTDSFGRIEQGVVTNPALVMTSMETYASARSLIHRAPPKFKELLRLLSGEFDPEFTQYLHKNKLIRKSSTNEDLMDGCISEGRFLRYKQPAYDFLGIPRSEAARYLKSLKQDRSHAGD